MEKILKIYKRKRDAIVWRLVKAMTRVWFSPWRSKFFLPLLRSKLFSFLTGDRQRVFFQRVLLKALRSPDIFLMNFEKTLRVCVTYRCNMACKACYARGLEQEVGSDMKLVDFRQLLKWASEKGWRKVRFLGGEPTVHPHFDEMLDAVYEQQMFVNIATNASFSGHIAEKLANPLVKDVAINYSAQLDLSGSGRSLFRRNIEFFQKHFIPFSFSYVLNAMGSTDISKEFFEDIRQFDLLYVRVSLALPSFSDTQEGFPWFKYRDIVFYQIKKILEHCARHYVPFYIYRPLPSCLFSAEQQRELKRYSPYIFFSRCPLAFFKECGYSGMVTVNPDMSTFPCTAVFVKGPRIFDFSNKNQIHDFFKEPLEKLFLSPVTGSCNACSYHAKFLDTVGKGLEKHTSDFNDQEICQGGCLSFRQHNFASSQCHSE